MSKTKTAVAFEFRNICKKYDIFVDLCRFVPEMLEKFCDQTLAVLVDISREKGLRTIGLYDDNLKEIMFFLDQGKIYNFCGEYVCESFEEFVTNQMDKEKVVSAKLNVKQRINQTFSELDIKVTKWQGMFLKEILQTMYKLNISRSTPEIIRITYGRVNRSAKDCDHLLRYYIKEIYKKVYAYANVQYKYCYVYKVIDILFDITFNRAEQ